MRVALPNHLLINVRSYCSLGRKCDRRIPNLANVRCLTASSRKGNRRELLLWKHPVCKLLFVRVIRFFVIYINVFVAHQLLRANVIIFWFTHCVFCSRLFKSNVFVLRYYRSWGWHRFTIKLRTHLKSNTRVTIIIRLLWIRWCDVTNYCRTRSSEMLNILHFRTASGQRTFYYRSVYGILYQMILNFVNLLTCLNCRLTPRLLKGNYHGNLMSFQNRKMFVWQNKQKIIV